MNYLTKNSWHALFHLQWKTEFMNIQIFNSLTADKYLLPYYKVQCVSASHWFKSRLVHCTRNWTGVTTTLNVCSSSICQLCWWFLRLMKTSSFLGAELWIFSAVRDIWLPLVAVTIHDWWSLLSSTLQKHCSINRITACCNVLLWVQPRWRKKQLLNVNQHEL